MRPELKAHLRQLQFEAVKEVFELDIKPEAVKNSPVTPEGYEINLAKGKKGVEAKGTGTNRKSIDVEVVADAKGPKATLFTQSGYGGYLEVGTQKMRAQPYLLPALMKFVGKIATVLRRKANA